ncbi:2,3-diaminopropionate biosynthesis protein SbnB [Actinoalloteichus hymeniacidonis]|uniref:2,3-diaminopropionate biosynthesis protein SbnB n=1 Tax=Actinoalloteichus hymeniacidonis TaxID=340345 RepID=A0AAC9MYT2_9PSEU|nr:2,3-diaminopropionate biosynthesis protein SbnB [Actinoalloteichus hymeniacidonis]AOS63779.1 2,3-diaminopropionate biosynthesis protein SbnB [Actinoalloteichus hymeniacidonis]MBB5908167.1 ornithine cyclodeaminase [Actinoalloteichus hymeniacidonis]
MTEPGFSVVGGAAVRAALAGRHAAVVEVIERAYLTHARGESVNPPSYFLRFPDRPSSRIIALPASVGGDEAVDGIKWISSFPGNIEHGLPRASAVLILNDPATGYPYACLESSIISATRTAASAALAADRLSRGARPRRVTFVGTGLIARYIHEFLAATGWEFDEVGVFDLRTEFASAFLDAIGADPERSVVHPDAESALRAADLVILATTAAAPHVVDPAWFAHNPLVLNVSLRDLSPEVILAAHNVLDDVEHCLKADTSPHLAEQHTGSREFVDGVLADVLRGDLVLERDRPVVFSPFGLGVLDLAVGRFVYEHAVASGQAVAVPDFFHELSRY